jgi:cysteine desulfurase
VTDAPAQGAAEGAAETLSEVYLDTASAEPLHPAAREILVRALDAGYADPRRLHQPGRRARMLLENARASVADTLAVAPDEVAFTPSGTHAVHLGLLGLVAGRNGARVIASAVEHSAVMHAGRWHAERGQGARFDTMPVDRVGRLGPEAVAEAGPADVLAVQAANHEVGTVQPVAELAARFGGPVFMDACAAGGRLPLPDGWTTAALSAHKWGGPAGVGVLLVRRRAAWRSPFPADDRADHLETGFENVPGALAAAAALRAVADDRETAERQRRLVDRIRAVVATLPDVDVAGDPVDRLPHLVTFSCLYVDGEALVTELDRCGFGVASGSACTASTLEPSHVLAAMGVLTHGNVRVSLARDTTEDDVDRFLATLPDVLHRLRAEVGL